MHGCGNDFVIIDNRNQKLELNNDEIKLLCDRHYGIGCDQFVVIDDNNKNNVSAYALFGIQMALFLLLVEMLQDV